MTPRVGPASPSDCVRVAPGGAFEYPCIKKSKPGQPGTAIEMTTVLTQTWNRKASTVYTRVLARAIEVAGSAETLAEFLASSPAELGKWATGTANPPMPIFLAMVDVVAANALTPAALDNLALARARRSSASVRGAA